MYRKMRLIPSSTFRLKTLLSAGAILTLAACGGGSSGGGGGGTSGGISGTTSKGIVSNGLVSAFAIINGIEAATAIATAVTDENGDYTLDLGSSYMGEPIVIRVSASSDTTMACDIQAGCTDASGNTVAFGESYPLSPDFELSALVPSVDDSANVSVGVTPLSTVSTALGLDAIGDLGAATDFNVTQAIETANSQVAERFGFSGSVIDIPVIDLTDPEDVAQGLMGASMTANPVEYAAINAAIISAVQSDNGSGTLSVEEAIEDFVEDFSTGGLPDNSVSDALTDLEDILEDALDILAEVETSLTDAGLTDAASDLADVADDVETDEMMAQSETPSDTGDQGTPSETAGEAELEQVKAFVAQLRDIGSAIEMSVLGDGEAEVTVEDALDNFETQVDAAEMLTSDDMEAALDALGQSIEAIVAVYDENFNLETGALLTGEDQGPITSLPGSSSFEGVTVNASAGETGTLLAVVQTISVGEPSIGVDVDLTFSLNSIAANETCTVDEDVSIPIVEGQFTYDDSIDDCLFSVSYDLDMMGTASTANVEISIDEGSNSSGTASVDFEKTIEDSTSGSTVTIVTNWVDDFDLSSFNLDLNFSAMQQGEIGDPLSFNGSLELSASNFEALFDEEEVIVFESGVFSSFEDSYSDTIDFGVIEFSLSGGVSNSENEFNLSLGMDIDGVGVTYTEMFDSSIDPFDYESDLDESSSNFIDASFNLAFDADLAGLTLEGDDVTVVLELDRTGLSEVEGSLELVFPGSMIQISSSAEGLEDDEDLLANITIENQDGVVAEFAVSDPVDSDGAANGTISVEGTVYAEIEPILEGDGTIVDYIDGTFESIF